MNRQQRRALSKQKADKRAFKDEVYRDVTKKLDEKIEKRIEEERWANIEAQYRILGYMLHREFGFGQKRILQAYQGMDKLVGELNNGTVSAEDIEQFMQKVRIEIAFN